MTFTDRERAPGSPELIRAIQDDIDHTQARLQATPRELLDPKDKKMKPNPLFFSLETILRSYRVELSRRVS